MRNCAECKHQEGADVEIGPGPIQYLPCRKFEPRGAANSPRITIDLSTRTGVSYKLENVSQRDAYRLLQGCWLAAGEMFQLLGDPKNVHTNNN